MASERKERKGGSLHQERKWVFFLSLSSFTSWRNKRPGVAGSRGSRTGAQERVRPRVQPLTRTTTRLLSVPRSYFPARLYWPVRCFVAVSRSPALSPPLCSFFRIRHPSNRCWITHLTHSVSACLPKLLFKRQSGLLFSTASEYFHFKNADGFQYIELQTIKRNHR